MGRRGSLRNRRAGGDRWAFLPPPRSGRGRETTAALHLFPRVVWCRQRLDNPRRAEEGGGAKSDSESKTKTDQQLGATMCSPVCGGGDGACGLHSSHRPLFARRPRALRENVRVEPIFLRNPGRSAVVFGNAREVPSLQGESDAGTGPEMNPRVPPAPRRGS